MRESTFVVLEEYLPKQGSAGSAGSVFSGAQFNVQLAKHNSLAVHAVFDNITPGSITRNLYIYTDESNDGRNWIQRSNPGNTYVSSDADLAIAIATTAVGPLQAVWSDAGYGVSKGGGNTYNTGPLLAFVRFRCFFDATDVAGHLRLTVCQRDR